MASKAETLNAIFKKYELSYDPSNPESKDNDVYAHKHYKIITRSGIQKIEARTGIKCQITLTASGDNFANVTGLGTSPEGKTYTTLASANEATCKNGYYVEMAEKRCRSRLILTLVGLYEQGVFGQDEFENGENVAEVKTAKYKA